MNWIQDNKFLVALTGATLAGMIGLFFLGNKGRKDYQAALEEYSAAAADASRYEKIVPYPRATNRDQKQNAVNSYRESIHALQESFGKYRVAAPETLSPQDFASRLKSVGEELIKRFAEKDVKVPENFFAGFAAYRSALPHAGSTGILAYELDAARAIFSELSDSGISELKNVYREQLPEERKETWQPAPGDVARALPLEITFSGNEKSVRNFITKMAATDQRYLVIRLLQVDNVKKTVPPMTSDAKFEQPKPAASPMDAAFSDFSSSQETTPAPAGGVPASEVAKPAALPADDSRILQQVLGAEELRVFIRLDIMQFLPAQKLP